MAGILERLQSVIGVERPTAAMVVLGRMFDGFLKSQKIEAQARSASVSEVNGIFRELAARAGQPDASFVLVQIRFPDGTEGLGFSVLGTQQSNQLTAGPEK